MAEPTYWLDLFTGTTWDEFLQAGGTVSGFRKGRRWATVKKIKQGDYFLCYMTGLSRWVGLLEVTGKPYQDEGQIWKDENYPCRVPVRVVISLEPEYGVPVINMKDQLSVFEGLKSPSRWSGAFRGSPSRWKNSDGEAVVRSLEDAVKNPIARKGRPMESAVKRMAVF